ncbi:MAG: hypothetical protein K2L12_05980 [Clostridia bacterium]|nr:hypothetical protein [Clostridia bacterium]
MLDKVYFNTFEEVEYNKTYNKTSKKADDLYEKFIETLSEEQKNDLIKLVDLYYDLQAEASHIFFDYGFKYAFRLASECCN